MVVQKLNSWGSKAGRASAVGAGGVLCLLAVLWAAEGIAFGQRQPAGSRTPRGGTGGGNVLQLDKKAEEAQQSFMRIAADLAKEYEDLGELTKAQDVLKKMLKLSPDLKQIEAKIKDLEEQRIAQNESFIDVDPARGWVATRIGVEKGNLVRFQAEGECRINLIVAVNAEGISTNDPKVDMVSEVPLGGLMGMIVDTKGKAGKPFAIGAQKEINADSTGQVLLRVNVPPQAKVNGKYRVQITGDILAESSSSSR